MKKGLSVFLILVAVSLGACGGGGSASGNQVPQQTNTLDSVTLPGFQSQTYIFNTAGATRAMVLLHGGGGYNYQIACDVGLNLHTSGLKCLPPTTDTIDWAWLSQNHFLAAFPQGQSINVPGNTLAFTWSNHVMTSGQDDVGFLQALAAYIHATYGISQIYLGGQSNGGMMANRMWCESPTTFSGYIGISGPASEYYLNASTPCNPSIVQPYLGIFGGQDTVLQVATFGDTAQTWEVNAQLVNASPQAFVDPVVIGEIVQEGHRSQLKCGQSLPTPVVNSRYETWTNCSGLLQLQEVFQSDHPISSLQANSGEQMRDLIAQFADTVESR